MERSCPLGGGSLGGVEGGDMRVFHTSTPSLWERCAGVEADNINSCSDTVSLQALNSHRKVRWTSTFGTGSAVLTVICRLCAVSQHSARPAKGLSGLVWRNVPGHIQVQGVDPIPGLVGNVGIRVTLRLSRRFHGRHLGTIRLRRNLLVGREYWRLGAKGGIRISFFL